MKNLPDTSPTRAEAAKEARPEELVPLAVTSPFRGSPCQRVMDWLFGRDFFISYRWSDGRDYAVKLAERLRAERFDCFLDSEGFVKGDNWQRIGDRELRKTSRLVLVASPQVHASEAVERELRAFGAKEGRVIALEFGDSLSAERFPDSAIVKCLDPNVIRHVEPLGALESGPSDDVMAELRRTFTSETSASRRLRAIQAAAALLLVLLVIAATTAFIANRERQTAERRADQLKLLTEAADAREQLNSAPRAVVARTVNLYDRAQTLFDEPPADLLKTVSQVWTRGREIGRTRFKAVRAVGSPDWIVPMFGFSKAGDAICVDLGPVEPDLLAVNEEPVFLWNFETGKRPNRDALLSDCQDSRDGRESMRDAMRRISVHGELEDDGLPSVFLHQSRVEVSTGSSPEAVIRHDDGINVALVVGVSRSLLITAGGRAFDSDDRSTHDAVIRFWKIESNGDVRKLETELHGHAGGVIALAFHFERQLLASMDQSGTIILWDVKDLDQPLRMGEPLLEAIGGAMYSVAANRDGSRISTVGYCGAGFIYEPSGAVVATFQGNGERGFLANLPGREGFIINGDSGFLSIGWDGQVLEETAATSVKMDQVRPVAFSPDGRLKAWCDNKTFWYCAEGQSPELLMQHEFHDDSSAEQAYHECKFSGEATLLASRLNGMLEVWNPLQRKMQAAVRIADGPLSFAPRPGATGELAVSSGADLIFGTLENEEWTVNLAVERTSGVSTLEASPDGRTLGLGRDDGGIELWDFPSRSLIRVLEGRHFGYVSDLEFSPNADRLYSCSRDGTALRYGPISVKEQVADIRLRLNLPALLQSRPATRPTEVSEVAGEERSAPTRTDPETDIALPSWILCCECPQTEIDAQRLCEAWKRRGFPSDYLWIPDYPSLSAQELWLVFVGPFDYEDKAGARTTLNEVKSHYPTAYGLKLDISIHRETLD